MATDALKSIYAFFGINFDDKGLQKAEKAIGDVRGKLTSLGIAFGEAFAVTEVADFVGTVLDRSSQMRRVAEQTGASIAEIAGLTPAFESVGLEIDDIGDAFVTLQEKAMEAARGNQDAADDFKAMGVDFKDAQGNLKTGPQLLADVADGLQGIANQSKRAGLASSLLNDPGRKLLPILQNGAAGLQRYRSEVEALGGVPSQRFFEITAETSRNINRLKVAFSGVSTQIATVIIPYVSKLVGWTTKLTVGFAQIAKNSHLIQVALGALATAMIAAGIKMALAWGGPIIIMAGLAVIIGAIVLAIDEFITFMEGGQTVLGEFIDSFAGIGSSAYVVRAIKEDWKALVDVIIAAKNAVHDFIMSTPGLRQIAGMFGMEERRPDLESRYRTERGARAAYEAERAAPPESGTRENIERLARARFMGWREFGERGTAAARRRYTEAAPERAAERNRERINAEKLADARTAREQERFRTVATRAYLQSAGIVPRTVARAAPRRAAQRNNVNVEGSSINLVINAGELSAEEVATIAKRELEQTLERQRRQTIAAFETTTEASEQ